MSFRVLTIVVFGAIAGLAGVLTWARRRRTSDEALVSLRKAIPPGSMIAPDPELRTSTDGWDDNAAPETESHSGSDQKRSEVCTEAEKRTLPPVDLVGLEKGATEAELPAGVLTADLVQIEGWHQGADSLPEVNAIAPVETATERSIESPIRPGVAEALLLDEGVPVVTAVVFPGTKSALSCDGILALRVRPIEVGGRIEEAPLADDVNVRVASAPDDSVQMGAQAPVDEGLRIEKSQNVETETTELTSNPINSDTQTASVSPQVVAVEHVAAQDQDPNAGAQPRQPRPADLAAIVVGYGDRFSSSSQFAESLATAESAEADTVQSVTEQSALFTAVQDDSASEVKREVGAAVTAAPTVARKRQTIYRDRRGSRRAGLPGARPPSSRVRAGTGTAPAEAFLRLSLHPIQRTVRLSLVLARPEGFPKQITLATEGQPSVLAYDTARYDDVDLPSGATLLGGELRFKSLERFQWVRSSRRVQIFATAPSEPDMISVSAARAGSEHAVLCRPSDVTEVRRIAKLAGSPPLVSHDGWLGVPTGCAVLSAYCPVRAIAEGVEPALSTLDPGASIAIELSGIPIRARVFAQGHPPLISIDGLPEGTVVSIGGEQARQCESGAWVASFWDAPGRHVIDVVPGPSVTYEIASDPASEEGWPSWDAHGLRFGASAAAPWERATICGARVMGPSGTVIIAAEPHARMVALGMHQTAAILRHRTDAPVCVGAVRGGAVFLWSDWGGRRSQGRVVWLGNTVAAQSQASSRPDWFWVETVRNAASRRLAVEGADQVGRRAWEEAVARARQLARSGR